MRITKERIVMVNGQPKKLKVREEVVPDTAAASMWLTNRAAKHWRNSKRLEISAGQGFAALVEAAMADRARPIDGDDAKPVEPVVIKHQST
jgi:hypothetical protein